jgi:hypothetical protein
MPVTASDISALSQLTALLEIERMDPALRDARSLDARIRRGEGAGPLAGSRILRDNAPAGVDGAGAADRRPDHRATVARILRPARSRPP